MKNYIYIGIENGFHTVIEVTMAKPNIDSYMNLHGFVDINSYELDKQKYAHHVSESKNRYIIPFEVPKEWKILDTLIEGKDFEIILQCRLNDDSNGEWSLVKLYEPQYKSFLYMQVAKPLPTDNTEQKEETEFFLPPDNGDICWEEGAQSFTRKEVFALLHTQRTMIANDLKANCGNELTDEMYQIINHPRIPKF